jgi:ribosome silencing factor RsfS/YbeB/iojap
LFPASTARRCSSVIPFELSLREDIVHGDGPHPLRIEGLDDARWVLMDYGDFIVHVFLDEARTYYDLERLWADAERLDWESLAPAHSVASGE